MAPVPFRSTLLRLLLIAVIALLPALLTIFLVGRLLQAPLSRFYPMWSDEVIYWLEVHAFRQAGYHGGYFTDDGLTAPLACMRFDPHGPAYPTLYGVLSLLSGWRHDSAPWLNMLVVALAIAGFFLLAKPRLRAFPLYVVLLLANWPLLFYLPSVMSEPAQLAGGILVAGLFAALPDSDPARRRRLCWALAAVVTGLAFLRFSWGVLYLPVFAAWAPPAGWRGWLRVLALSAAAALAVFGLFTLIAPPYPAGFLNAFHLTVGWGPKMQIFGRHLQENLGLIARGHLLELLARALLLLTLLAVIARGIVRWWAARRGAARRETFPLLHAVNLAVLPLLTIAFYDVADWRDTRTLAPHLLCSALLFTRTAGRSALVFTALTALLACSQVPAFLGAYRQFHADHFAADTTDIARFAAAMAPVQFTPGAPGWENTLVWGTRMPISRVTTALPPGLGLTAVLDPSIPRAPLRARYLLLDPVTAYRLRLAGNLPPEEQLRVLNPTPWGTLYEWTRATALP
jgi:hypothetical protein